MRRIEEQTVGSGSPPIWSSKLQHSDDIEALLALFEAIAAQEKWQHGGELRHHSHRSTYLGLYHRSEVQGQEIIGGIQLVLADPETGTLPCHRVWTELPVPVHAGIAHAAVLAVASEWRGRRDSEENRLPAAFWTLCASLWRHCLATGITELWLEATPTMLRCYRFLGWPLIVQGPLRSHWGEECYPCKVILREVAGSLAEKATRSLLYKSIFLHALALPVAKSELS